MVVATLLVAYVGKLFGKICLFFCKLVYVYNMFVNPFLILLIYSSQSLVPEMYVARSHFMLSLLVYGLNFAGIFHGSPKHASQTKRVPYGEELCYRICML